MKEFLDYTIRKEDLNTQHGAGRYNPALEIVYTIDNVKYINTLSAGYRDDINVYLNKQTDSLYVLTENSGLEYMGLEIFNKGENCGDVFLNSSDLETDFDLFDMSNIDKIDYLENYIY